MSMLVFWLATPYGLVVETNVAEEHCPEDQHRHLHHREILKSHDTYVGKKKLENSRKDNAS
jgi:hypothetical protein